MKRRTWFFLILTAGKDITMLPMPAGSGDSLFNLKSKWKKNGKKLYVMIAPMNEDKTHTFIEKNSMLVREFDRYVLEHPEFADRLPDNALLIMQID